MLSAKCQRRKGHRHLGQFSHASKEGRCPRAGVPPCLGVELRPWSPTSPMSPSTSRRGPGSRPGHQWRRAPSRVGVVGVVHQRDLARHQRQHQCANAPSPAQTLPRPRNHRCRWHARRQRCRRRCQGVLHVVPTRNGQPVLQVLAPAWAPDLWHHAPSEPGWPPVPAHLRFLEANVHWRR